MSRGDDYDWWAAEGRPEHLRPLDELGERMCRDPELEAHGITIFAMGVDLERELLNVEVAAADATRATALLHERYGDRIEVEVVAYAAYVIEDVPWESWTPAPRDTELIIWLIDSEDDPELDCLVSETEREVVVTLRGPRWQGARPAVAVIVRKLIELTAPVGHRRVIDGATGKVRPQREPLV